MNSDVSTWRVLVVDDNPDSIETLKMVLGASGATIFQAENGVQALEIFKREHPDLVLSDISMPEMDGWQLIKEIRTDAENGATPVIALTAHAMVGDRERVLEAGFNGYLSKPLHMFTLLDALKSFVAKENEDKKGEE